MKFNNRDDIIQLTPLWNGERMPDGRPRVSDDILRRIKNTTMEEMWAPMVRQGYKFQHETRMRRTNPDMDVVVGRAFTAMYMRTRPDLAGYLIDYGHNVEGRKGGFNQWPLDELSRDDFMVNDMYGKTREGCPWGGNLTTLIAQKTGVGGLCWGGVRDLDQIKGIKNAQFYYLETDPTPFMESMCVGINVPVQIGMAVCMPGDVVLGTESGVIFIPAHLAEACVIDAEKTHARDIWGFTRLHESKYSAAQIDSAWDLAMWEDFYAWFGVAEEALPYKHLSFDEEMYNIRNGIRPTPPVLDPYGRPVKRPANAEAPKAPAEDTRW